MNRLFLLLILLGVHLISHAQTGYLFVKKGQKKVRTYTEGDNIQFKLQDGSIRYGMITRLMNDTIYLSGRPVPRMTVREVMLPRKQKKSFEVDAKTLLLITAGVALVTAGLTLSKQADFQEALIAGLVIGYGPLGIRYAASKISFHRKRYKIGRKFRLQVLDFYIPRQPSRAF